MSNKGIILNAMIWGCTAPKLKWPEDHDQISYLLEMPVNITFDFFRKS